MVKPNFIIAGAQKSGTTTLFDILKQHPDIFLPEIKETHFFDNDFFYQKGLTWYTKTFFKNHAGERAVGDNTPDFMFEPDVPKRIYENLGKETKLIFILRNPADRMYSYYNMQLKSGVISPDTSFYKYVKEELKRPEPPEPKNSFIIPSLYGKLVERYLKYFPIENMFFICFEEDFLLHPNSTIIKLQKYIGVEPIELKTNIRSNPRREPRLRLVWKIWNLPSVKNFGKKILRDPNKRRKFRWLVDKLNTKTVKSSSKLEPEVRKELINDIFMQDIKKLEKFTNKDFGIWYQDK